jgi:hypothetical protein
MKQLTKTRNHRQFHRFIIARIAKEAPDKNVISLLDKIAESLF